MSGCLFCELAEKPVPHEVYRDQDAYAILVPHPIRPGHCMVLPRDHYPYFDDLPSALAAHLMGLGQKIARLQKAIFDVPRVAFLYTGGDIAHAHAHLVPMTEKTDITSTAYIRQTNLTFSEAPPADPAAIATIGAQLRAALT